MVARSSWFCSLVMPRLVSSTRLLKGLEVFGRLLTRRRLMRLGLPEPFGFLSAGRLSAIEMVLSVNVFTSIR